MVPPGLYPNTEWSSIYETLRLTSFTSKTESALCELCNVKENAEHKLLHCPDLDELRYKLDYQDIAENILTPNEKLDLGTLSKLTARCNLFN